MLFNIWLMLALMCLLHIFDDFYLQGILATLKQSKYWQEHVPNKLYKYDYIAALVIHALSWSIMISLPLYCASGWNPHWALFIISGVNLIIHAFVDDLKANKKKISLVTDQAIHFIQILITWIIYVVAFK